MPEDHSNALPRPPHHVLDAVMKRRAVTALEGVPLRLVSQAASRRNITFVLRDADVPHAMMRLHETFFNSQVSSFNSQQVES